MLHANGWISPAIVFARPTADQIWLGAAQKAALSRFLGTARIRFLVGPRSSGKSSLLQHVAAQIDPECVVLRCRGPKRDAASVLASLLLSADLAPWDLSAVEQRNLLAVFVQQRRSQNRRIVVAIDDVHAFDDEAWEEIERLLAFKIDRHAAMEFLLAGPPSIVERFDPARLDIDPNTVIAHSLAAASQSELASYIHWRLARFEIAHLITPVATQMIARLSAGRYAAADLLCQMSLLVQKQLHLERVDARVVRHALTTLAARQSSRLESAEAYAGEPAFETRPPRGYTFVSRNGKVLSRVELGQRTMIGRSEHNDLCLASPYLSRHHAVIIGTPQAYYVVDLNSTNGVLLNGAPVARAMLCDQDVLTLGPFRLKMQIPSWLAQGHSLPEADTLETTAIMPPQLPQTPATMRRVK